jgi:hypothetical protein
MKLHWVFITLLAVVGVGMPGAEAGSAEPGPQQKKEEPKAKPKAEGAALTGCVDEQDGHYVLVDDQSLNPIANLEADGFETEAFAKHMGHKVTVRGTSNPAGARPTFKVRTIETVSETCAPQPKQP